MYVMSLVQCVTRVSTCAQSGWPAEHSIFSALTQLPSNQNTSDSPVKAENLKSPIIRCSVLKSDANTTANSTVSGDFKSLFTDDKGQVVAQLVEALCYKPEG
jgi:hypothetical protein